MYESDKIKDKWGDYVVVKGQGMDSYAVSVHNYHKNGQWVGFNLVLSRKNVKRLRKALKAAL